MDGGEPELAGAGIREAMGFTGWADDHMPPVDDDAALADLERRLARLHDEDLGIRVTMQLRADARLRVNEDHAEGHVAVLATDELVRVLGVLEVVERDDVAVGPSRCLRRAHR